MVLHWGGIFKKGLFPSLSKTSLNECGGVKKKFWEFPPTQNFGRKKKRVIDERGNRHKKEEPVSSSRGR